MALRDTIRLTYGASRHTARATPMAPLWGRHTAPPHGYALVACGNAANICRALLIACSPRFVAGTNGSGIRGVVQIVP